MYYLLGMTGCVKYFVDACVLCYERKRGMFKPTLCTVILKHGIMHTLLSGNKTEMVNDLMDEIFEVFWID